MPCLTMILGSEKILSDSVSEDDCSDIYGCLGHTIIWRGDHVTDSSREVDSDAESCEYEENDT